jgi:hypothetical protein
MDLVARVLANAFAAISGFHVASLETKDSELQQPALIS